MTLEERDQTIHFASRRMHPGAAPAHFEAVWSRKEALPEARPGSREYFLTERYCLYALRGGRVFRARLHHDPWPLCAANLRFYTSTMIEAHGLATPDAAPLIHAQHKLLDVKIWKLESV